MKAIIVTQTDTKFSFDFIYPTILSSQAKDESWAPRCAIGPKYLRVDFSNLEAGEVVSWSRCNRVSALS